MLAHYPQSWVIDLLHPGILRDYQAFPERLYEVVQASPFKTIIIDEIQKAPELLSIVHSLIEQKQGWQFILTGSSARKLKRAGVDLMAGRAVVKYMHPFMALVFASRGIFTSFRAGCATTTLFLMRRSRIPIIAMANGNQQWHV